MEKDIFQGLWNIAGNKTMRRRQKKLELLGSKGASKHYVALLVRKGNKKLLVKEKGASRPIKIY